MSVPTPILQYNLSDASVKGLLPSGYTPLAYVEFTNADRLINTGITSNNNLKFESKWGNLTNGGLLYGDNNIISAYASVISNTYNWRWGTLAPSSPKPIIDSEINYIEQSKNGVKINGVLLSTYSGTSSFSSASSIYLFGSTNSTYYLTGKCYYFKIWNNGSLVRDFVPCIDSSNIVGLYDLVGRLFYSPSSNVLIAGPELAVGKNGGKSLPEEYLLVEYLESHGNDNSPYLSFTNRTLLADDIVQINTSLNRKNNGTLPTWLGGGGEVLIFTNSSGNLAYWKSANVEAVTPDAGTSITLNLRYFIKSKIKNTVNTWALFAYGSSGSYPIDGKIEMMSVTRGSSVILKLIPCYRKSDMKPGMYDVVNGEFKTSAASDEFILGPSITNCYTYEPNAGSGTYLGFYTDLSGIYDSSKGWIADFNGNTSKLISLSNPSFVLPLSVSCWINFSVINSHYQYAISYNRSNGGTSDHLFGIGAYSSKLAFWSCGAATLIDDSISTNTWYHVTLTINSSKQATFYLNGVLKYQGTPGNSSITATDFWIGCRCAGKYWFNGMLSNVQIWDSVLTAAQVKELYGK